ncbi:hypothetical protein CTI12_AA108540 [Artemisia annua]|uniref:Helitron helicase-like domain-containing protein n=1 Tax=Artemisia annua TaxID=35608 RepID=A0A2U1PHQ3_ARTAN|nr:hypothetical protein CTI12_AA108540 [Artemisia annua]
MVCFDIRNFRLLWMLEKVSECGVTACKRKRVRVDGIGDDVSQKRVRSYVDVEPVVSDGQPDGCSSSQQQQTTDTSVWRQCGQMCDAVSDSLRTEHRPVLLDFGAGIIRHEAFADLEGYEFVDESVQRTPVYEPRPPGVRVGQKRVRVPDDGLSQRPRLRPRNASLQPPFSQPIRMADAQVEPETTGQPRSRPSGFSMADVNAFTTGTSTDRPPGFVSGASSFFHTPIHDGGGDQRRSTRVHHAGAPAEYLRFSPCNCMCSKCHATFWYEERLSTSTRRSGPLYHRFCMGGKVRTARDKLLDAPIPEFKIKLFGVVGSAQHELPTANEVGAIVFDYGPDSVTDFDVVIQRHSGDPESINKLHPAYMSLHFSLLFIFGEQGYHTELKLVDVAGGSSEGSKRMSMDAHYAYLLHDRFNR